MEWTENDKDTIWTEIVTEKIYQQAQLLEQLEKREHKLLRTYIDQIVFGDLTNREGHAAKVYFNALFGKNFTRTEDNPINAALNYGYSILLSMFNREIVANGYITQIGLFHNNMFNQFNLASDFMEPFRPIIDKKVYSMDVKVFETYQKHDMLEILNKEVVIGGKNEYLTNAIKIYTRSIFDALNDKDLSQIRFYRDEL